MKHINVKFTDDEFEKLEFVKDELQGYESWRNAILEEFGVKSE